MSDNVNADPHLFSGYTMYNNSDAQRTLRSKYMTHYHIQAQWAEFTRLKEIIGETYRVFKRPLRIFDIGIGYSRIPIWLSRVATWNKVGKYTGIDICDHCISQSKRIIQIGKIADKVELLKYDAVKLSSGLPELLEKHTYDLVLCTYFTAGDFKPAQVRLETRKDGLIVDYNPNVLRPNKSFVAVFKGGYDLLHEGGKIVIGSIYWNNDFVRRVQEDFYRKCGMTVITSDKDLFTATLEGFWSERFDQGRLYSNLEWLPKKKIRLVDLDDYTFAFMVVIDK